MGCPRQPAYLIEFNRYFVLCVNSIDQTQLSINRDITSSPKGILRSPPVLAGIIHPPIHLRETWERSTAPHLVTRETEAAKGGTRALAKSRARLSSSEYEFPMFVERGLGQALGRLASDILRAGA